MRRVATVGAEASTSPLFARSSRSAPGTTAETMVSMSMLTSLPDSLIRGRTFSAMPVARYLKLNEILLALLPVPSWLVAMGMSVPTRMVACRLSRVSTLGRDKISALPSSTRARRRTIQFLLKLLLSSKLPLSVFKVGPVVSAPSTHSKLPS